MKNNIYRYICPAVLLVAMTFASLPVDAQKNSRKTISVEVIDEAGEPIAYPEVSSSKNRYTFNGDKDGKLSISVPATDVLKVKADGYGTQTVEIVAVKGNKVRVRLAEYPEYEDEDHRIYTVTGDWITERRSVGSFSKVSGDELESNPTMFLWDALGGRLGGLYIMNNAMVPGFTSYSGFVRAPQGGTPIIMIDGVERSIDYIEPETIESVELLKDASLKSLFGGIQSNGILMIKTKRGKAYENGVRINVQSGAEIPDRLPEYLNSRDYVTMYNQALKNTGMAPAYEPERYDGSDPLLYPDVDFYKEFLHRAMSITRANAQLSGGSRNTQYFLNLGYQTNGGLEKYTSYPNRDKVLTVRGNIDNTIYDFITLKVGLNAAIQTKTWPNTSTQNFIGALSDTRPNEYPVRIPGEMVGNNSEYVLGGTAVRMNNPLGLLTRNGYVQREYSYMQTDFSLGFDLDRWVKGLTVRPSFTFDLYNEYSSRKDGGFSVYQPVAGEDAPTFLNWGYDNPNTKQVRGGVSTNRNWAVSTTAEYNRSFEDHEITALATWFMQKQDFNDQIHGMKRFNVGAMANYAFRKTYVADISLNYVGVPSFAKGRRFGAFPTVGAGWIMTGNRFLSDVKWLDYLKVRASYGILGSTSYTEKGIVSNYYYRTEWQTGGVYQFPTFDNILRLNLTGNPDIGFQKSHEINAGVDFELFGHSLSGSAGWFRNQMNGGLASMADIIPGVSGKGGALVWQNYKKYLAQGAEAELHYTRRFGNFKLTAGGNFTYGCSKVLREVDTDWPEELQALAKLRNDGDIRGYRIIGTFRDQADIERSPVQTFGKVYPGDFKYADINGDGIVDERDREVIGNVQPSISYGITVKLAWKGFNLDLMGYGLAGFDRMLTNKYYQIYGTRKYSAVVTDGLPNGNPHPELRADASGNNFVNSDWWKIDGGYFKLRNAELGYTLPYNITSKIGINRIKIFVRGANLFTISKIKDLDPESLDAGVTDFPLCTTVTGGLSVSF